MIIVSRFAPKGLCINLFGIYWTRDASWIDKYIINHERIHTAQGKELLWLPFYVAYIIEWLYHLARLRNWQKAYLAISFEREAYAHGRDLSYLPRRKHYAQWRNRKS